MSSHCYHPPCSRSSKLIPPAHLCLPRSPLPPSLHTFLWQEHLRPYCLHLSQHNLILPLRHRGEGEEWSTAPSSTRVGKDQLNGCWHLY